MVYLHISAYIVSPIINVELLLKNYLNIILFLIYITNAITILIYIYIYYILCLST